MAILIYTGAAILRLAEAGPGADRGQHSVHRLLAIELQSIHHRSIGKGKKHGFVIGDIFMRMRLPERHDERVALLPLKITFADPTAPLSPDNVVNGCARMAVSAGEFLPFQKLNLA